MSKKVALNKIVAVEKSVKSTSYKRISELHKQVQKAALLSGISRTYRPKDDDGEPLPPEETRVQLRASDALRDAARELEKLFDVVATKDWGNTEATADLEVEGEVLLEKVPVTYLLFLEKQLTDYRTFIEKVPVVDQSEAWEFDENAACFATKAVETHRTKKVPRTLIKYEATEEHPAQTEVWQEDVIVGFWRTVKYSGALAAQRKKQLSERVDALLRAVKYAREEANSHKVEQMKVGAKVFDWILR